MYPECHPESSGFLVSGRSPKKPEDSGYERMTGPTLSCDSWTKQFQDVDALGGGVVRWVNGGRQKSSPQRKKDGVTLVWSSGSDMERMFFLCVIFVGVCNPFLGHGFQCLRVPQKFLFFVSGLQTLSLWVLPVSALCQYQIRSGWVYNLTSVRRS